MLSGLVMICRFFEQMRKNGLGKAAEIDFAIGRRYCSEVEGTVRAAAAKTAAAPKAYRTNFLCFIRFGSIASAPRRLFLSSS